MSILSAISLCGGQGKTTIILMLAKLLASRGKRVLAIDADPQSSLTTFLRFRVELESPTLLEVLKKEVETVEGIYETGVENLYLIPSDNGLTTVEDYLARSGSGISTLRKRLRGVEKAFDAILIDPPPQRSQICLTVIGASQKLAIPAEASVKGLQSLARTIELLRELREDDEDLGEILGVVPFRDRWVGRNRTRESQENIDLMGSVAGEHLGPESMLPTIRESEIFKRAINKGKTPYELGDADLMYPLEYIAERIQPVASHA